MVSKNYNLEFGKRLNDSANVDEALRSKVSISRQREIERAQEIADAEHEAKMAELEKKRKTAEADAEKVDKKIEHKPPFEIKGGIDIGQIDLQQAAREAQAELKQMRLEAEQSAARQGQVNDELREKLHSKEIEVLRVTFQAQMDMLTRALESNKANQKSLLDQLADVRETAKALGLAEPHGAGDLMIQVELKKLDLDHQMALRKMTREEKQQDRQFQLDLRRLDDERDSKKAELEMKRKSSEFWQGAPALIGQALSDGMKARQTEGRVAEADSPPPLKERGKFHIEVGRGESGEVDCPECGTVIAVGPTARKAVCAGCGLEAPIRRAKTEEPEEMTGEEQESGFRPTY